MPSINMIAPRRAEKQRLERDMRRLVIVILAEMIFAVVLGGWVCTKILTTRSRIADMDIEITKLQPLVKDIQHYEAAITALKPKLGLLNQAKERTMQWYDTLDRLTQSMPQSTYLTRLAANEDTQKKQTTLGISGISASQARVGETMLRLQTIPAFEDVELHFTQKVTSGPANAVEFEIGAPLKSTDPAKGVKPSGSS